MKICTKCKIDQDENEFYKSNRHLSGLKSWCKSCCRADNNKRECNYNHKRRKYREDHKEESRVNKRAYYINNKNAVLSMNSKWRQTINGKWTSYVRGAKKRNIEWSLTKDEFISYWNLNCFYCGDQINGVGIDRLDSSKGYAIENIVPCCHLCNTMKMEHSFEAFTDKVIKIYNNLQLNIIKIK